MVDYLKENLVVIAVTVVVILFLIRFGRKAADAIRLSRRIDREGVEADAVVSRVVYDRDVDGGGSYLTYVTFRDETGTEREALAANRSIAEYEVSDRLRIKFAPGEYDMVKPVRGE